MTYSMTAAQHQKLLDLAMQPETASKLVKKIEAMPGAARALWDVLCVAIVTSGFAS